MKLIELDSLYTQMPLYIPQQKENEEYGVGEKVIYVDESEEETHEEPAVVKTKNLEGVDKDDIRYTIRIIRNANEHDLQMFDSYQGQAKEALGIFAGLIKKYKLPMKEIGCTYSMKGNRAHFLFTAAERVDFRELVKDLAKQIKKKIYLRQIGPRDRAKLVGSYGKCGQRCCCNRHLKNLKGVTMETARVQGVAGKGSSKLLGCCGKLLCCLNYEYEFYAAQAEKFPEEREKIKVKGKGKGEVINCDYLNEEMRVFMEGGKVERVKLDEVEFLEKKKKREVKKKGGDEEVKEEK